MNGPVVILGLLILQALLIASLAQKKYRRTGILWFVIAIAINAALVTFTDSAIQSDPKWILDPEYRAKYDSTPYQIAFFLMVAVPSTAVLLLILATLPRRDVAKRAVEPANSKLFEADGVLAGFPYQTHPDGSIDALMHGGLVRFKTVEQFVAATEANSVGPIRKS
ncbi:MAG: hypothetical protein WCE79_05095 [Xanthobacteraceae bacterium]